ncbi:3-hydroxyacyl-CoA dehydrogenase [Sphingopyxis lindanitolerans]|uniref:3-hydroxyacyl-CoA dehydrogenase n=1 Tax=Sphingopyxis lindanitolerans TaxID=2054227 RepID=A0A2S8B1N8_9SPHN|nr:SDR family oxidoreductase [Sphingopyxis lindanitolerans]PQM26324.1 3-hydroxyacyl-CoA dehydrogenase [Sphingopyxis lindanitolerans]
MKTAAITGAASGIGRQIAIALAAQGAWRLVLLDIDADGLAETGRLACAVETRQIRIDLTDADAIAAAFAAIGASEEPIDLLFNCAGIPAGTPPWPDTRASRIKAILDLNLAGTILSVQVALPLMRKPGGSIVNIASISGLNPYLSGAVYAASKAGVIMFTRCCADLAATQGVRVNALCPGIVDTPFLQKTGIGGDKADWLEERLRERSVLSASEVADAAIALALRSDAAGLYEELVAPNPAS